METVLCYIENNKNEYLMLHRVKKNNDLNEGKWIGVGGHIKTCESIDDALIREVNEETGLILNSFIKRGIVRFINDDYSEIMHLYTSNSYSGDIIDCDEGILKWIPKNEIFSLNLWEGDRIFLNKLINDDEYFDIKLIYSNNTFIRSE